MPDSTSTAFTCSICNTTVCAPNPPDACPKCGAGKEAFQAHTAPRAYVIIGAGIAGVSAAEAVRKADPTGQITLLSKEHELPYFRINLTRYLAGEMDDSKLDLHPQAWYADNRVELLLDAEVTEINRAAKQVRLADGRLLGYDKLVLAAGASPFVPPFEGTHLAGVQTLRTLQDANAILNVCCDPIHVVCIGGGLLGLEVAGAIARRGAMVSVIESLDWLLPRQLDKAASRILTHKIEEMGISVLVGARTKALQGDEHVQEVLLEDGRSLPADLVVISAGVHANLALANSAGLEVKRGVLVDEHMRTSDPDIYAAGDDAEFHGIMYGLWVPAKSQGTTAGLSAAGKDAAFPGAPPSARLKVLGIDLFSIGQFTPQAEGDRALSQATDGNYASFVLREGVLIGAILLGDASLANKVKAAVEGSAHLGDDLPDVPAVMKALGG